MQENEIYRKEIRCCNCGHEKTVNIQKGIPVHTVINKENEGQKKCERCGCINWGIMGNS